MIVIQEKYTKQPKYVRRLKKFNHILHERSKPTITFYLFSKSLEMETDIMVELPEVRELTEGEIKFLKENSKFLDGKIQWSINDAGTVQIGIIDVRLSEPQKAPFLAQTLMEMVVKIIIPSNKFSFYYRVKATSQIIRMYHNQPGHDDISGKIEGPHKHYFESKWVKKAYSVNDVDTEKPIKAIEDFCIEEYISFDDSIYPFMRQDNLEGWL